MTRFVDDREEEAELYIPGSEQMLCEEKRAVASDAR